MNREFDSSYSRDQALSFKLGMGRRDVHWGAEDIDRWEREGIR